MSMFPPGSVLVVEHKTSGADVEDGSPYWKRLRLDAQVSTYMVGARSLGFEPVGVLYDVLKKPEARLALATPVEKRKYTKATKKEPSRLFANQRETDEHPEEFRERVRAEIMAAPDAFFKRGLVVRSEDEEREAHEDTVEYAEQITRARERGYWHRNVDACERYGRFCDFFPVCCGEADVMDPVWFARDPSGHRELSAGKRHLPIVTSSSIKTFRRCPREYYFSYEVGARSHREANALAIGTLVHVGLEVWWKTVDILRVYTALSASTKNDEHRVLAEEMLRAYHARWIDEAFDVLAVEREFSMPLIPGRWALAGKIDAIARVSHPIANEETPAE